MIKSAKKISTAIDSIINKIGLTKRLKGQLCLLVWDEVVGEKIAQNTKPTSVKDGILYVSTKSHVWAQELTLLKHDIIQKLNQRIGERAIEDIRFRAYPFTKGPGGKGLAVREAHKTYGELSPAEKAKIEKMLEPIKDDKLKEVMRKVLLSKM